MDPMEKCAASLGDLAAVDLHHCYHQAQTQRIEHTVIASPLWLTTFVSQVMMSGKAHMPALLRGLIVQIGGENNGNSTVEL
jgi:hypothetical protein